LDAPLYPSAEIHLAAKTAFQFNGFMHCTVSNGVLLLQILMGLVKGKRFLAVLTPLQDFVLKDVIKRNNEPFERTGRELALDHATDSN